MNDRDLRIARTHGMLMGCRMMLRHFVHRRTVEVPDGQRALFLAPHPDDLEIGCGGTLLKMLAAGRQVRLVYLTDGSAVGTPDQDAHFAKVRREEADAVVRRLGLPPQQFPAYPERAYRNPQQRADRVADLVGFLDAFQPDAVFTSWFTDQHPDHRYTCHLLAEALRASAHRPAIYGYEALSFVPPGLVVDISAQLPEKLELVRLFRSQFDFLDYAQVVETKARTHASLVPGASACEVFCPMTAERFLDAEAEFALDDVAGCSEVLLTPP